MSDCCNPMDCSPPGSSVHGILQARTGVGCHFLLQGIFPTQELNPGLLHCRQILYQLSYQGSPNVRVKIGNLIYLTNGEKTQELKVLEYAAAVAAAAKSLQSCPTLCDPTQAPPYPGFSRQEHWSGLPFPSPMHESEK